MSFPQQSYVLLSSEKQLAETMAKKPAEVKNIMKMSFRKKLDPDQSSSTQPSPELPKTPPEPPMPAPSVSGYMIKPSHGSKALIRPTLSQTSLLKNDEKNHFYTGPLNMLIKPSGPR